MSASQVKVPAGERLRRGRWINHRVVAVVENEWAQLARNRVVVLTTFAPPFLFVGLALTVLYISTFIDLSPEAVEKMNVSLGASLPSSVEALTRTDAIRAALLNPFLILFMMLPIVVPL